AAVAAVAVVVTATASKYKKMGQGKETRQFRELMEMRTGWKMMNATDSVIHFSWTYHEGFRTCIPLTDSVGFCVASLPCHFEFQYLITLGSLTKSYPLFYNVLCAVSMSVLYGCNSVIREVCRCRYVGIGGIIILCTLLVVVALYLGLSTAYIAVHSIF
ncbi:MAG: hypothetical protein EZS28_009828, partial [Streblomastix strix]